MRLVKFGEFEYEVKKELGEFYPKISDWVHKFLNSHKYTCEEILIFRGSDTDGGDVVFRFLTESSKAFCESDSLSEFLPIKTGDVNFFPKLFMGQVIGEKFLVLSGNNGDDQLTFLFPLISKE